MISSSTLVRLLHYQIIIILRIAFHLSNGVTRSSTPSSDQYRNQNIKKERKIYGLIAAAVSFLQIKYWC